MASASAEEDAPDDVEATLAKRPTPAMHSGTCCGGLGGGVGGPHAKPVAEGFMALMKSSTRNAGCAQYSHSSFERRTLPSRRTPWRRKSVTANWSLSTSSPAGGRSVPTATHSRPEGGCSPGASKIRRAGTK